MGTLSFPARTVVMPGGLSLRAAGGKLLLDQLAAGQHLLLDTGPKS
jgi:hypothetical protein